MPAFREGRNRQVRNLPHQKNGIVLAQERRSTAFLVLWLLRKTSWPATAPQGRMHPMKATRQLLQDPAVDAVQSAHLAFPLANTRL